MNVQLLIDSIVRQVTVLIAQLATSGGVRAPVAHIANQVFVDLANELASQGVSRKVSADMFGMALRAYIRKLRRLNESSTERGRSLWKAVLDALSQAEPLTRDEVLARFASDDEAQVRAVLHDLSESGLVFVAGPASDPMYRAASDAELSRMRQVSSAEGLLELIWVLVYREGPLSREALDKKLRIDELQLSALLAQLCESQRLRVEQRDGQHVYSATDFSIPLDARAGWEAAVFDHFQAMVQTISQRLQGAGRTAHATDTVGGSTYSFDVWQEHPLAAEVYGSLQKFRTDQSALRARVDAHNQQHGLPAEYEQVVFYGGQCILERGAGNAGEDENV